MTVQRSANASSLAQDWMGAAERARKAVEAAPTGRKLAAVERVAADYGVGHDLLRRAVTALRMVERLKARGVALPDELRRVPVGVVDVIARWAAYDRAAAVDALHRYHNGDLQFRELMRAEAAARPAGSKRRAPRRVDVVRAWKESALDKLAKALREAGLVLADDAATDLPVDALARGSVEQAATAILIVGPYDDAAQYDQAMVGVLLHALGIARLGHPAWVVVPGQRIGPLYEAWLAGHGVPSSEVRVVALCKPPRLSDYG